MSVRLYYDDSFLLEFDAQVTDIIPAPQGETRPAVILDRTAFYPTSGGQVCDTGWMARAGAGGDEIECSVVEVADREDGAILHFLSATSPLSPGMVVHGKIDATRRLDHIQQHSGQHVLSAALLRLFNAPTVSFHMGEESCTIDLDVKALTPEQIIAAERLANEIILENRPVEVRYASPEDAQSMGLRKIPRIDRGELRLVAIQDFDLNACGGTHVRSTGQIGCILLRKTEKVRQGVRLEFVCGQRAVATARREYGALAEAAELFSANLLDVPQHIHKAQEEAKATRRSRERLLEELAGELALRLITETPVVNGRRVVVGVFADRDLDFIRLLAQKCARASDDVITLLASTAGPTALVFAQSTGQPYDMGTLMKEVLAKLGGRGGGGKDMAQGGTAESKAVGLVLAEVGERLRAGD